MRGSTASLEPLRERPFRLLFFGRGLSAVGDAIVPVAVTFAVLKHGNATDLGIVLGAQWGAQVIVHGLLQGLAGELGYAVFRYRVLKAGSATVSLKYWRQFEGEGSAIRRFTAVLEAR